MHTCLLTDLALFVLTSTFPPLSVVCTYAHILTHHFKVYFLVKLALSICPVESQSSVIFLSILIGPTETFHIFLDTVSNLHQSALHTVYVFSYVCLSSDFFFMHMLSAFL